MVYGLGFRVLGLMSVCMRSVMMTCPDARYAEALGSVVA